MIWMRYEKSKCLKEGDVLLVNQNVNKIITSSGQEIRLWEHDEVIFKESVSQDEIAEEHVFVVYLRTDSTREEPYGDFILTNYEIEGRCM